MPRVTATTKTTMVLAALLLAAPPTHGGCGCDKPPPPPSQVLPHVTWAGMPVRLLNQVFADGQTYVVTFASGTSAATTAVAGVVSERRDLADTLYKPELVIALPALPLGPASITISDPLTGAVVSQVADSDFTVAATPSSTRGKQKMHLVATARSGSQKTFL